MFCTHCGYRISEDSVFCPSCGHPVKKQQPSPSVSSTVPVQEAPNHSQYQAPRVSVNTEPMIDEKEKNSLATRTFVLGLVGAICAVAGSSIITGIAAIILAILAFHASSEYCEKYGVPSSGKAALGHAFAKMAIIIGPIMMVFAVISMIYSFVLVTIIDTFIDELFEEIAEMRVLNQFSSIFLS